MQFLALGAFFLQRGQRHRSFAALGFPLCVTGCRVLNVIADSQILFRLVLVELFDGVRDTIRQRLTVFNCVRHADAARQFGGKVVYIKIVTHDFTFCLRFFTWRALLVAGTAASVLVSACTGLAVAVRP
ncbi:hypothetical protein D3C86_1711420 [compost metagenome]